MQTPLPMPQQLQFVPHEPPCYPSLWSQSFVQPNPNFDYPVAHQFKTPIFPIDSPTECNTIYFREGRGVNLETSHITTQNLPPGETLIHKPLEEQSMIENCLKTIVEAHKEENPRISFNPPCQLEESKCQVVEDLYELKNHQNVDLIESWFQTIINTQHSLIIRHLLVPYQSKQLVSHTLVCIEVHYLKLSVSIFSILLRIWLHWKYAYT